MAIRGGRGRGGWTLDGIEKAKKSPKSTSMTTAQFKKVESGKVSESDLQKSFKQMAQVAMLSHGVEMATQIHNDIIDQVEDANPLLGHYHMCLKGPLSHFYIR